jgi:hypothetical protein
MPIASKLTLLAMLAIAGTAFAAPSASAQTEPEVHNQAPRLIVQQEVHAAGDVNCPLVTPSPPVSPPFLPPPIADGGCRLHMTSVGDIDISIHDFSGIELLVSRCFYEFDMRIDVAGEGYLTHQELTGPSCGRKACGQLTPPTSEGRIWSFFLQESEVAGSTDRERLTFLLCTEPTGAGGGVGHCEITVPMLSQPTTHRYRFEAVDVAGHGVQASRCEWDGVFDVEATPGVSGEGLAEQSIEVRHT